MLGRDTGGGSAETAAPWPGTLRPQGGRALDLVAREAALIISCACVALIWLTNLSVQVAADSWLNLLGGREILRHGLPHHDTLAVLSQGREWIDQQWLANLFYYGVYAIGGLSLAARVNVALFITVLGLVFTVARRRGASRLSVMLCSIPMCVVGLEFIRAQVLVEPLFVLLVALLAAESRRPSARILLVFPMLALWANLHGSVIVAAALVALLGVTEAVAAARRRAAFMRPIALILTPWPFVFASPYGLSLAHYYTMTLRNPLFPKFLTEWAPPIPLSIWGVPLLVLAGTALFLFARHPRVWTAFETGAMVFTLGGGLLAVRSIPWFALTAAILLPTLLDRELPQRDNQPRIGRNRALALSGVVLTVALVAHSFANPGNTLATDWPQQGLTRVGQVLRADPDARVLASYDLADWVLFRTPEVRGRLAFDGRWEILPPTLFKKIMWFQMQKGPGWERPSRGYRLLVLNPMTFPQLVATYEQRPGVHVLYRSGRVVVLDRGPTADPRSG
jgi:hypothetical protein